ncbi:ketoacyl-ACP synthase III [Nocardia grenadensis]|uniref:ketoacyl-ACP synthase III n=1 Tax=Nocardia grenadensis TaxID=931537 RepID=UPI003D708DDE
MRHHTAGPAPIALTAIGTHLPGKRLRNAEAAPSLAVTEEFLNTKIGITARAVKEPGQRASDLCAAAFADLCGRIRIDPAAIQLCCVVTQNPDMPIPHTAAILHEKLGLAKQCMTFDLSQGCAGYTHGLAVVTALADRFGFDHALLFTCDPYSEIVDPHDRDTALLFGDGATVSYCATGAGGYRIVDADFGTVPGTSSLIRSDTDRLAMQGRGVFLNAAREGPASIRRVLERNDLTIGDIRVFLVHPGSKRIVDTLRDDLEVDESRLPFEIAEYGNTVSSSIPLMLAARLGQRPPTDIVLSGFGVGFSWGTCLVRATEKEK